MLLLVHDNWKLKMQCTRELSLETIRESSFEVCGVLRFLAHGVTLIQYINNSSAVVWEYMASLNSTSLKKKTPQVYDLIACAC